MSEYTEVEQPFLHQLQALGWDIIDQGRLRDSLFYRRFSRGPFALDRGSIGCPLSYLKKLFSREGTKEKMSYKNYPC